MIIESMQGLGDNIYQRAFLQNATSTVWLTTPWPEIYRDLPYVRPLFRRTTLRTQSKNQRRKPRPWAAPPGEPMPRRRARYQNGNVFDGLQASIGLPKGPMTLPSFDTAQLPGKPYAIVRPVTVRSEWRNESRNCDPAYVREASLQLKERGISVISIADIAEGHEWAVGEMPYADVQFNHGELNVEQMLALVEHAWLVVGPVGWIVPACLAYKTHAMVICGGQGGFNHPEMLTDPDREVPQVRFAVPEPMCKCKEKTHACQKEIPHFGNRFKAYLDSRIADGV